MRELQIFKTEAKKQRFFRNEMPSGGIRVPLTPVASMIHVSRQPGWNCR
jgi:hypothetical protein